MSTSKSASPASRAAATRSGRETVPNSGPMKMAARFSAPCLVAFDVAAFGADQIARPGREGGEGDLVFLVRLLHAGRLEIFQDHLDEVPLVAVRRLCVHRGVDQFVVLIHGQHAVRRQALHGERPGHADLLLVLVGLVVEVFELGFGGDGRVDLLLPGDALLPPLGVQLPRLLRPFRHRPRGGFPIPPTSCSSAWLSLFAQRFQHFLILFPDHVDLGVVGDGFEGDMRHALIDEALADVAARGLGRGAVRVTSASLIWPSRLSASR